MVNDQNQYKHRAAIAEKLGLITEEDWILLSGATEGTVEAWRKRGQGPEYVRIGNRVYYPETLLQQHIDRLLRKKADLRKPDLYQDGDD